MGSNFSGFTASLVLLFSFPPFVAHTRSRNILTSVLSDVCESYISDYRTRTHLIVVATSIHKSGSISKSGCENVKQTDQILFGPGAVEQPAALGILLSLLGIQCLLIESAIAAGFSGSVLGAFMALIFKLRDCGGSYSYYIPFMTLFYSTQRTGHVCNLDS